MPIRARLVALSAALLLAAPAAAAISGVCPDGSIFIVQSADAIPCREAKRVDPSDLPPLQPELLPRPYGWERFNRRADPNNPYNLVDTGAADPRRRPTAAAPSARPRRAARPRRSRRLRRRRRSPRSRRRRRWPRALDSRAHAARTSPTSTRSSRSRSRSLRPTLSRYGADGERTALLQLARSSGFEQRVHAALAAQGRRRARAGGAVPRRGARARARSTGTSPSCRATSRSIPIPRTRAVRRDRRRARRARRGPARARLCGAARAPRSGAAARHLLGRPPHHRDAVAAATN